MEGNPGVFEPSSMSYGWNFQYKLRIGFISGPHYDFEAILHNTRGLFKLSRHPQQALTSYQNSHELKT